MRSVFMVFFALVVVCATESTEVAEPRDQSARVLLRSGDHDIRSIVNPLDWIKCAIKLAVNIWKCFAKESSVEANFFRDMSMSSSSESYSSYDSTVEESSNESELSIIGWYFLGYSIHAILQAF